MKCAILSLINCFKWLLKWSNGFYSASLVFSCWFLQCVLVLRSCLFMIWLHLPYNSYTTCLAYHVGLYQTISYYWSLTASGEDTHTNILTSQTKIISKNKVRAGLWLTHASFINPPQKCRFTCAPLIILCLTKTLLCNLIIHSYFSMVNYNFLSYFTYVYTCMYAHIYVVCTFRTMREYKYKI